MGTIAEKLQYTKDSVDDIQSALIEKGVAVADTDALDTYGDKIRGLSNMNVYRKVCDFSAGSWTGATLSNSEWKNFSPSSTNSTWTYYYENNIRIDPKKVEFITGAIIETNNWIRITRGYASNSTTTQFQYTPCLCAYGDKINTLLHGTSHYGSIYYYNNSVYTSYMLNNYSGATSSSEYGILNVYVYNDHITFEFKNEGRGLGAIKSASPKFEFAIGYTS